MSDYLHSPLLQALRRHAENNGSKIAVVLGGAEITYSELLLQSKKAAMALHNRNIYAGQKIVISAHKNINFLYVYLGAQMLGVVNVVVDAESNVDRLSYIENKVRPVFCFGYASSSFPSSGFAELNIGNQEPFEENANKSLSSTDDAEILFTTGTTGAPKGVCLSYANISASAENINQYIGNSSDDVEVLGLPICHSFGLGRIRCNILAGSTLIILGNFANVRLFFKTIEQFHATGFGVVPAAWAYIRKISGRRIGKYSNQIKYIEIGSAEMPYSTKQEMLEMFPHTRICMHYGLTEASRSCFIEFHDKGHLDSIGKPVCEKVDVKIFGTDGKELPNNEPGELCVKGNMVLSRYIEENNNVDAFYGDFFRTGDIAYKSTDGYIYLIGRDKEFINVGGKKVSPMEVEEAVCAVGVGDCICVSMKDPDGIMGELVMCFVLRNSTALTFEQIAGRLQEKLEPFKRPVKYEWIDEIPKTASGKKQRIILNGK